ncbi:MAG: ATP-binding cassette domain-containing protein [Clostridia bacterium]|nr:ATP-binding cassette domain-containing protein [Clostridia bacterium]
MLSINGITKAFGENLVLDEFSFEFPEKGLFLLRGKSGVGKTTLLRIIAGLEKPDRGSICRKGVLSMVFQEARLLPFSTLWENVLIVKRERDEKRAEALLKQFGLWEARALFPDALSGGMRLRGAIVRTLYYGGDIFLWDEPTKELDPENRALVRGAIEALAREKLVIVVTHDPDLKGGTEIELK